MTRQFSPKLQSKPAAATKLRPFYYMKKTTAVSYLIVSTLCQLPSVAFPHDGLLAKSPAPVISTTWRNWSAQRWDRFSHTLALIESGDNPKAVGDEGRSLGLYQFKRGTWNDTSKEMIARGLKATPWRQGAVDVWISNHYAKMHLENCAYVITEHFGYVTEQWLYLAWNCGLTRVLKTHGNMHRLPAESLKRAAGFSRTIIYVVRPN